MELGSDCQPAGRQPCSYVCMYVCTITVYAGSRLAGAQATEQRLSGMGGRLVSGEWSGLGSCWPRGDAAPALQFAGSSKQEQRRRAFRIDCAIALF